jgi:hypothetical protein
MVCESVGSITHGLMRRPDFKSGETIPTESALYLQMRRCPLTIWRRSFDNQVTSPPHLPNTKRVQSLNGPNGDVYVDEIMRRL